MKKLLAILCCLAFAMGVAEAKTYYVDAKRPNNNGNGLKPATAKKTIQAAINIAAAGDTILVYPGTYPAIKTNNKKIAIKSVKGASKTRVVTSSVVIAQLGKRIAGDGYTEYPGKDTSLVGFLLDGRNYHRPTLGVGGGQLKSCCIQGVIGSGEPVAGDATFTGCIIRNNTGSSENCIFSRSKIMGNSVSFFGGRFSNCLVIGNEGGCPLFWGTVLVNCTLVKNWTWFWPTWYSSGDKPVFSRESKFFNCILRNNYHRVMDSNSNGQTVYGKIVIHNADTAKTYANTYYQTFTDNRNPKFVDVDKGDYRLQKGSCCINKGKLTDTLKRYVGTLDLAGKMRVRGSAIDMGCYEY